MVPITDSKRNDTVHVRVRLQVQLAKVQIEWQRAKVVPLPKFGYELACTRAFWFQPGLCAQVL